MPSAAAAKRPAGKASQGSAHPGRSAGLDGLRGLAALSVVVFHVWLYGPDRVRGVRSELFDHVAFNFHLGLICFFVLSGFLLYRGFAKAALVGSKRVDVHDYAVRRVARIVPAYYVNILGCLALYALLGITVLNPPWQEFPLFLVFAQNYSMGTLMKINAVTWTLSVEVAFYIALPLIGWVAFKLGRARPARQLALLLMLLGLSMLWNDIFRDTKMHEIAKKSLPSYLGCFAVGMIAALWFENRRRLGRPPLRPRVSGLVVLAGAAVVVLGGWWKESWSVLSDLHAPLGNIVPSVGFALLVAAVAAGTGKAVAVFSVKPLANVGVVSYGIYLWHVPLIVVGTELGVLPENFGLRVATVAVAAIGFGFASWRLVEEPLIERAARFLAARRGNTANTGGSQAVPASDGAL